MSEPLEITVWGDPAPKGSARAFVISKMGQKARAIVTHDNKATVPWLHAIVDATRDALGGRPPLAEVPVAVELRFYVKRPTTLPKKFWMPIKTRGTDLDKLERNVLDGLTRAGVYRDDCQVCSVKHSKVFAGGWGDLPTGIPRVVITVRELPPETMFLPGL